MKFNIKSLFDMNVRKKIFKNVLNYREVRNDLMRNILKLNTLSNSKTTFE
jgi:hypothetical protein